MKVTFAQIYWKVRKAKITIHDIFYPMPCETTSMTLLSVKYLTISWRNYKIITFQGVSPPNLILMAVWIGKCPEKLWKSDWNKVDCWFSKLYHPVSMVLAIIWCWCYGHGTGCLWLLLLFKPKTGGGMWYNI